MLKKTITITITLLMLVSASFAASVKWQPGHYMRFKNGYSESAIRNFLSNQYTKGILVQISWRTLEPSRDHYDFSRIDYYLNLVQEYDKYFILSILDRCFNDNCSTANSPSYLRTSEFNGGVTPMYRSNGEVKGSVVRIWDAAVSNRITALYRALGSRYENNPTFVAMINPEETALGVDRSTSGYSDAAYEEQLRRQLQAKAQYMHSTLTVMGINYIQGTGGRQAVFNRFADLLTTFGNGGLSHPDTAPDVNAHPGYPVEIEFNDRLAIMPEFQTWIWERYVTEEDVYLFARDTLGAHYCIWNPHFTSSRSGTERPNYISNYVLPVINRYRGEINTNCPSSFSGCIGDGDGTSGSSTSSQPSDIGYSLAENLENGINLDGAVFSGTEELYIYYDGSRPSNLDVVNFQLDTVWQNSDLQPPYRMYNGGMPLDVSTLSPGEHTVAAILKDADRNLITRTLVTFRISR